MRTFAEWWDWGVGQAEAARREVPLRINDEDLPSEAESLDQNVIHGLPFTHAFESYVMDEPVRSPFRTAMARLYNPRKVQAHEYRILFALLEGHTDPEAVRALIGGCRQDYFEAAAVRALSYLLGRISSELPAPEPLTHRLASIRSEQQKTRRGPRTSPATGIGQRSYRHAHK